MKLAYIILAHKNWEQLGLLVRGLKEDWNDIFVHVDAKSNFDELAFQKACDGTPVNFVRPRINVHWAHISIVHATINLLRSVNNQPESYDRIVLLSGQDLPIVSNDVIKSFFEANPTTEYFGYKKLPLHWWAYGGWDRILVYNFPASLGPFWNRAIRVVQMNLPFRRKGPLNRNVYGYSQWFNLTGAAAKYVLTRVDTTNILKFFDYSYCADEFFFQTVLMNSAFAERCKNNDLRFQIWDENTSRPKDLEMNDWEVIKKETRNCLFARKFDCTIDSQIVNEFLREAKQSNH